MGHFRVTLTCGTPHTHTQSDCVRLCVCVPASLPQQSRASRSNRPPVNCVISTLRTEKWFRFHPLGASRSLFPFPNLFPDAKFSGPHRHRSPLSHIQVCLRSDYRLTIQDVARFKSRPRVHERPGSSPLVVTGANRAPALPH